MAAVSHSVSHPTPIPDPVSSETNSYTNREETSETPRSADHPSLEPSAEDPIVRLAAERTQLPSATSAGLSPASQKPGGLFAFAAAALDKTFAGISEPRIRPRQSLSRLSIGPDSGLFSGQHSPTKNPRNSRTASSLSSSTLLHGDVKLSSTASLPKDPPSQPYSETDPTRPQPIHLPRIDSKMHQTSSRLLRMTDDDRPFTRVCPNSVSQPVRRVHALQATPGLECLNAETSSVTDELTLLMPYLQFPFT